MDASLVSELSLNKEYCRLPEASGGAGEASFLFGSYYKLD